MDQKNKYDSVIIGGGHNGLVAACYLAMAGKRVLILEKNDYIGGATCSKKVFSGVEANLSVYSYLVSLFPEKIYKDLRLNVEIRRRSVASYTPFIKDGKHDGLLISNTDDNITRQSYLNITGSEQEYLNYRKLEHMIGVFAQKLWPTLLKPLLSKTAIEKWFQSAEEHRVWRGLVEEPLGYLIEEFLADDIVRGVIFTDAKIGVSTNPDDPSLLQNRTFIYHVIGQGTGEWRVPVGGMGALVSALLKKAISLGVEIQTSATVNSIQYGLPTSSVLYFQEDVQKSVDANTLLFNTSSDITNRILPGTYQEEQKEGSVFKINMVLRKLPRLKGTAVSSIDAFTGTFHINEGYENMRRSYDNSNSGPIETIPGEMYCHSLTDSSILSNELQSQGYQTLTLFGLDVPYRWFLQDNARKKEEITRAYLRAINQYIDEDIEDCLALDSSGKPCIEAKSPLDLEKSLGMPKGNIFHGNLSWPFAQTEDEIGMWGVETNYPNVYICGSSARRGGAVSGIPGHNASMKILEKERSLNI